MSEQVMLKGDQGEALIFRWDSERNNFQSDALKRPVFDEVLTVEVITPGSKESSPVHELLRKFDPETQMPDRERPHTINKYRRQYDAFLQGNASRDIIGTPIEQWPTATPSLVGMCKEAGIFTVDALAILSDEKLRKLGMGGREIRERAKAWVAASQGNAPLEALAAENERLRASVEDLTARIDALGKPPAKTGSKEV
jgi:hypothetical protein